MGKIKHNKLKNTAILFELLCKYLVYESMNPSLPQKSSKLIKKFFNKDSSLLSELKLYQQLSETNIKVPANDLVSLVIESRKNIDQVKLNNEKFNLVKKLKESYDLDTFFKNRISNYKLFASIYNIFEHNSFDDPTSFLNNKQTIIESLTQVPTVIEEDHQIKELIKETPTIRKKVLERMVDKFNDKYKSLNDRQRILISKCITENVEEPSFKDYVITECNNISKQMKYKMDNIDEPVLKIKLNEVNNLLQTIITAHNIKDEHLSSMLKYYELLEEI